MQSDPSVSGASTRPTTPIDVLGVPDSIEGVLLAPVGAFLEAMALSGANSWRYTDRLPCARTESELEGAAAPFFAGEAMTMMIVVGDKGALALQQLGKQLMETGLVPKVEAPVPTLDAAQIRSLHQMTKDAIRGKEEQLYLERQTNAYFWQDKRERTIRDEIVKLVQLQQALEDSSL